MKPIPIRTISSAAAIALLLPGIAPGQALAQGQPQRGGQGEAVQAVADAKVLAQVRVPTSHANIHSGPSSGNEVLVLAAIARMRVLRAAPRALAHDGRRIREHEARRSAFAPCLQQAARVIEMKVRQLGIAYA